MEKYEFLGPIDLNSNIAAHWKMNVIDRSKYQPHQGKKECERRRIRILGKSDELGT